MGTMWWILPGLLFAFAPWLDVLQERSVKSLFLCECLTREHRAPVVHAAAA